MSDLPSRADIIIIGGGVIGASVAYHLAQKGVTNIVLLEKGAVGAQGATAKCLGGFRTQFSTEINIRFSLLSKATFDSFKTDLGMDIDFLPLGYLFLATEKQHLRVIENTVSLMASLGCSAEVLPSERIARRWPFIDTRDLLGGSYTDRDGFYGPNEVVQGFARQAQKLGVKIFENVEVTNLKVEHGRIKGVQTSGGHNIQAEGVVNAAGPWSGQIASLAGLDLPINPLRRHLFFVEAFDELPDQFPFIYDMANGWYIRREGRGLILGGPPGEASFSDKVDFEALEWTAIASLKRIPVLERASIARGWVGHYEVTPDHHSVIGEFPEVKGLFIVSGFSGHGFQHSPTAGRVTAEMILDGQASTIDIHPLRPTRFRENDLIHEPLTAFKA
ncbi:MAG: FAD-binding oxidoreductase [Deltaproteobacteria bacterium]|nr:FAD-binding oxidoreductase [Deltaproteobacteria bacterium]